MLKRKKIPIITSRYLRISECTRGQRSVIQGIGVILISGILALLLFCILLLPGWAASPVFVTCGIVIVSSVVIAIFALVSFHAYRSLRRDSVERMVSESISHKVHTTDAQVTASTCPICLSPLKDGSTLHQTECCSNHLHRKCHRAYIRHFRENHAADPPCVLCRARALSVGV
jgi:hypothetical protein